MAGEEVLWDQADWDEGSLRGMYVRPVRSRSNAEVDWGDATYRFPDFTGTGSNRMYNPAQWTKCCSQWRAWCCSR